MTEEQSLQKKLLPPLSEKIKRTFSANTIFVWSFMITLAVTDACWAQYDGMTVLASNMFLTKSIICLLLAAIICKHLLKRDMPAQLTHMAAVICVFLPLSYILSYLAVSAHYPLIDSRLAAADRALGLGWPASYHWVNAHPRILVILSKAYDSFTAQFLALLALFFWQERYDRGWELIWLSMLCCVACVLVSIPFPAAGAFHYYGIPGRNAYVRVFMALHQGHLKIIGNRHLKGIIQFPSFHTMMAVVLAYSARGFGLLSIGYVLLNILVLVSAPYLGGHHYADIWGGLVLALAVILAERHVCARLLKKTF